MAGWRYSAKRIVPRILRRTLGRSAFVRLSRFLLNEARLDTPNLELEHNGELLVQRVVVEYAAESPDELVVLDVGAHVGEWSSYLLDECRQRGLERVHLTCFEPASDARRELERATRAARVDVVPMVVSDGSGAVDLHITGGGVSSVHEQATRPTVKLERVESVTLDDFCGQAGLGRIDLVKVDAEGHDMAVMRGARGLLEQQTIGVLQFEYNHRWVMARAFLRDAFTLLIPLGYRLGKVTPFGIEFYGDWHPDLETFSQGNYLACTEAWARRFPAVRWYRDPAPAAGYAQSA